VHAQVIGVSPLSFLFGESPSYVLAEGALGALTARVVCDYRMVPADRETEAQLTVHLSDAAGQPVAHRMLALLFAQGDGQLMPVQPVTDGEGIAEFTYRAGRLAITNRFDLIDVSTGSTLEVVLPTSLVAEVSIELISPADYARRVASASVRPDIFNLELTAFPEALPADEVSCSRLTAHLTYKDGRPAAGFPVSFRIVSGYGGVTQEQKLTDADGVISGFYRVGNRIGTVIVEAVEQTTGKRASVEIVVVEAGPAKLKLWLEDDGGGVFAERAVMPADGVATMMVVAQVLSLVDTPIAGARVQFKLVNELGRLEVMEAETDGSGCIHALYTAGAFTGTEQIIAYLISG